MIGSVKIIKTFLLMTVILSSTAVSTVAAQPWEFNLSQSNELPDGEQYATVSLSYIYEGLKRGVKITVTANESILSPCSNFGIQRFGFNTTLAHLPPPCPAGDTDRDGVDDCIDNCPSHPNGPNGGICTRGRIGAPCWAAGDCGADGFCSKAQEDTSPQGGDGCGDACECEGNFNGDADQDGTEAFSFKSDFGRGRLRNPCTDMEPCYGDFTSDGDVDGVDAFKFKEDFGRGLLNNTCPNTGINLNLTLPPGWTGSFKHSNYSEFGWFQIDTRGKGSSRVNPLVIKIYHPTQNLSYTDFTVPNEKGRLFAAHIADYTYKGCSGCLSGFFSGGEGPVTTTSSVLTTSTTTSALTTTITTSVPPITTTSTAPVTTTTVPPTTTTQPTTSVPMTTTTSVGTICRGKIYKGGICELALPIDEPAYNRPGRRGLALTCEDVVDFCICTDCVNLDPACLIWTVDPADPYLSIIAYPNGSARLVVGESCDQLEAIKEYTVTVTDTCNGWSDRVVVELGKVTMDVDDVTAQVGSDALLVPVKLMNRYNPVRALSADICGCEGGDDRVTCSGCTINPERALDFSCLAAEIENGCCRVVLFSTNPDALIPRGSGPVLNVIYEATETFDGCTCLRPVNRQVSDRFNETLCACQSPGDLCFRSCGDIYPRDCPDPGCAPCGDSVVNLFDVLEAVDIILGLQTPTACQLDHGDVPNGLPPYCGEPAGSPNCLSDGDIDVLDVLVIIDMAQGRDNCCDYCLFSRIF